MFLGYDFQALNGIFLQFYVVMVIQFLNQDRNSVCSVDGLDGMRLQIQNLKNTDARIYHYFRVSKNLVYLF